jgi:hypothetical protein
VTGAACTDPHRCEGLSASRFHRGDERPGRGSPLREALRLGARQRLGRAYTSLAVRAGPRISLHRRARAREVVATLVGAAEAAGLSARFPCRNEQTRPLPLVWPAGVLFSQLVLGTGLERSLRSCVRRIPTNTRPRAEPLAREGLPTWRCGGLDDELAHVGHGSGRQGGEVGREPAPARQPKPSPAYAGRLSPRWGEYWSLA